VISAWANITTFEELPPMLIAAVLMTLALTPPEAIYQPTPHDGDSAKIEAVRQHIDAFEISARQAKGKSNEDAQKLSALAKQYADAAAVFDTWRTAAVSAKETSGDSSRVGDLARQAARAMAGFGRDARTFATGRQSTVDAQALGRFEVRLIDASRALARADEQTRQRANTTLVCRPWSEIR
jgi:hypothetical protein